jgi:hypothetical protein
MDGKQLDTILGLQLTVAWAGERAEDPARLNWWNTDLIDEAAGGDLFRRLLPRTAVWAGLQLAREAAIRVDAAARSSLALADRTWTLFHFGFEVDEALQERLEHHKRHGHEPKAVFGDRWPVGERWDQGQFEAFLKSLGPVKLKEAVSGRKLTLAELTPETAARLLAAALLPLSEAYPLPHCDAPEGASHQPAANP